MKIFFKIFFSNFLILLLLLLTIELFFGYWFDSNSFGPYMREHRMKKVLYSLKHNNENYNFEYKRNYHGFRGKEIKPSSIKALFIGGSTADERYKPEEFTITEYLNKKLFNENIDIQIINAGIEGQSTIGHLNNFIDWFPKLKNFSPKYIIFYVGINDAAVSISKKNDKTDGFVLNSNKIEILKDNLKSRSLLYDLLRKIKHKYYKSDEIKRVVYDFDYMMSKKRDDKFNYLNFEQKLRFYNIEDLLDKHKNRIDHYLGNIDKLDIYSRSIGAIPIFINQEVYDHEPSEKEKLFILNRSLIKHCLNKDYKCIDLARKINGKKEYWWDGVHTTIPGSKIIADIIYLDLVKYFYKLIQS